MEQIRFQFVILQVMRSPKSFREAIDAGEQLEAWRWSLLLDRHKDDPFNFDLIESDPWRWPHRNAANLLVPPEAVVAVQRWLVVEYPHVEWQPRHVIIELAGLMYFLDALNGTAPQQKIKPRVLRHGGT